MSWLILWLPLHHGRLQWREMQFIYQQPRDQGHCDGRWGRIQARFKVWHQTRKRFVFSLSLNVMTNIVICDPLWQRMTKSMGRSRDNEKIPPRGHFINNNNYIWFIHIVGRLLDDFLSAHSPFRPITVKVNDKSLLWLNQWKSFQLHFLEMASLLVLPP